MPAQTSPSPSRTVQPPAEEPPQSSARAPLLLGIIGFLLLLGVSAWLWTELQDVRHQLAARPETAIDPARIEALEGQLRASQQQIETLTAKVQQPPPAPPPPPAPVDLAPLEARLAALEQRPLPVPPAPVDLGPLEARLATLENRPPPDDSAVRARLAELNTRLEGVGKQLDAAEAQSSQSGARIARAASLQAASLALDAGRPLGELTGASAPLQRYATNPPPTEAALRLSFETAARAAEAATDPAAGATDVGDRIWQRVQSLVTVRRGDHVLVGDPAAVVLAEARRKLVAGDLAGAVAALDRLDAGAAKAMLSWRGEAQALLDARTALASLTTDSAAKP